MGKDYAIDSVAEWVHVAQQQEAVSDTEAETETDAPLEQRQLGH